MNTRIYTLLKQKKSM